MKVANMTKKPRENRVPIMLSDEELGAIDDWRFENRVATRSDAIRRLVRIALLLDMQAEDFAVGLQHYSIELMQFIAMWLQQNKDRDADPAVQEEGQRLMALAEKLEPIAMAGRKLAEQGLVLRSAETIQEAIAASTAIAEKAEEELSEFLRVIRS